MFKLLPICFAKSMHISFSRKRETAKQHIANEMYFKSGK